MLWNHGRVQHGSVASQVVIEQVCEAVMHYMLRASGNYFTKVSLLSADMKWLAGASEMTG